MNAYALAEIERLLANLIRVGTVAALDAAAARVTVDVGGLTTDWLPWITGRAGETRTWSAPRPGEQVLVLAPYGDLAQAIVLPALYQDARPAPAASQDIERITYPDGSTVDYDSAQGQLTVTVAAAGRVIVNCQTATINAADSVTLATPQTICTGALTVQGPLTWLAGMTGSGDAAVAGNVAVAGGLSNNGTNVGAGHRHSGVEQGKDTSGPVL